MCARHRTPHLADARHLGADDGQLLLARADLHLQRAVESASCPWSRAAFPNACRWSQLEQALSWTGADGKGQLSSQCKSVPPPTCRAPLSAISWLLWCTCSSRSWCSFTTCKGGGQGWYNQHSD